MENIYERIYAGYVVFQVYKQYDFQKHFIDFSVFSVNGTRLTPPKPILELEEQLGCWFDLSKKPISNQRLVFAEQWQGFSDEILNRPVDSKSSSYDISLSRLVRNIYP